MKKIGMLIAVDRELLTALERYGAPRGEALRSGFRVLEYGGDDYTIYVVKSGAGELSAAAATQLLIGELGVDLVVNVGVVGGLTEDMTVTKACVVERVVHYDYDVSQYEPVEPARYAQYPDIYIPLPKELVELAVETHPELKRVTCASGDKFVGRAEDKRKLSELYGADICEMEAAAIALTCDRAGVPCLLIKAVSDAIDGGAAEFDAQVRHTAGIGIEIADKIIKKIR